MFKFVNSCAIFKQFLDVVVPRIVSCDIFKLVIILPHLAEVPLGLLLHVNQGLDSLLRF